MEPQAHEGQNNGEVALAIHREEDQDVLIVYMRTVYTFLSSPRVLTFLKWTLISSVSVGVCAVVVHYFVRHQNSALRNALKSSIDALKTTIETENAALIRTVEVQNSIIKAEQEMISTLYQSFERRTEVGNETVQRLLETVQKLTEQNAKSIEQLSRHQQLASAAIQKSAGGSDSNSIEKQIGSAVTWCVGKGIGMVKGLFGWSW